MPRTALPCRFYRTRSRLLAFWHTFLAWLIEKAYAGYSYSEDVEVSSRLLIRKFANVPHSAPQKQGKPRSTQNSLRLSRLPYTSSNLLIFESFCSIIFFYF